MLAMDDSASIFCARLMRGTMSIASTVIFLAFSAASISSFWAGQMNEIRVLPSGAAAISASDGARTLTMTSACSHRSAAVSTTVTPASA